MPDDFIHRLLRRFGRPAEMRPLWRPGDAALDDRLDALEREQREIQARIDLIERQGDPRGFRRDDY